MGFAKVDVADEGDFDNCGCDGINDNMMMKRCQKESWLFTDDESEIDTTLLSSAATLRLTKLHFTSRIKE